MEDVIAYLQNLGIKFEICKKIVFHLAKLMEFAKEHNLTEVDLNKIFILAKQYQFSEQNYVQTAKNFQPCNIPLAQSYLLKLNEMIERENLGKQLRGTTSPTEHKFQASTPDTFDLSSYLDKKQKISQRNERKSKLQKEIQEIKSYSLNQNTPNQKQSKKYSISQGVSIASPTNVKKDKIDVFYKYSKQQIIDNIQKHIQKCLFSNKTNLNLPKNLNQLNSKNLISSPDGSNKIFTKHSDFYQIMSMSEGIIKVAKCLICEQLFYNLGEFESVTDQQVVSSEHCIHCEH